MNWIYFFVVRTLLSK